MKTFKQMFDEVMSLAQRKAVGRRMKIMGKKASVQAKKKRNNLLLKLC